MNEAVFLRHKKRKKYEEHVSKINRRRRESFYSDSFIVSKLHFRKPFSIHSNVYDIIKMLWQKESNTDGTGYIDILQNTKIPLANFRLNRKKNNAQSLSARTEGNRKYAQNDIDGAMEAFALPKRAPNI